MLQKLLVLYVYLHVILWPLGKTVDQDYGTGDCSLGQYRQSIGMFNSYKIKPGLPRKSISEILVEILFFVKLTITNCVNSLPIVVLRSTLKLFIISSLSPFIFLSIITLSFYSESYPSTGKNSVIQSAFLRTTQLMSYFVSTSKIPRTKSLPLKVILIATLFSIAHILLLRGTIHPNPGLIFNKNNKLPFASWNLYSIMARNNIPN